jgi:hypothetical protein
MIIKNMNVQGKAEVLEYLQKQEEEAAHIAQEKEHVAHMFEDAKIKELYSKATANIARAREDHSRSESNLGLYEERLSMIERNKALTLKERQAALTSLLDNMQRFGQIETEHSQLQLDIQNQQTNMDIEAEKQDVERRTESNKFLMQIMQQMPAQDNEGGQYGSA